LITMDLARELKVAQLPWQPRRGDLAMDRLNVPFIVLADGADEAGAVLVDAGLGVERRHFLGLTWLPRLDQLYAFLARHGPFEVSAQPAGEARKDVTWRVTLAVLGGGDALQFQSTNAADAAAQALHYLLAETGWRPGPPLKGDPA
jgi:hypothetical protein